MVYICRIHPNDLMAVIHFLVAEGCLSAEIHGQICAFCNAACVCNIVVVDWPHMLEQADSEQWTYHDWDRLTLSLI